MHSSPRVSQFSDGERFPYLEDQDGLMSLWPTLFTIAELRKTKEANTIRNELAAISHLRIWECLHKRNLLDEIANQQFPTEGDILSLRDHCYSDARDLKSYMARVKSMPSNAIALIAPIQKISLQTVEQSHAYNRITTVGKFLYFCALAIFRGRPNVGELNARAKAMREAMLAQRPKGKANRSGLAVHPFPQHFDEFMAVVAEDSPDNPFKSEKIRLRNFAMLKMLFETGMRSGELLSLYVGDVTYDDHGDPIIRIVDRRDDPNDPRINPPQVKTLERDLPISHELYEKLQHYISAVRFYTPNARRHPLLFVNHRGGEYQGSPMTDKNFQLEVKRVVAVRPDRFKDIRRHGFRHNFNVHLTDKLDIYSAQGKPLSDKERLDIRKSLNGHKGDGSGDVYEKNATRAKAMKAMSGFQGKQAAVLKEALVQAKQRKGIVDDDDI